MPNKKERPSNGRSRDEKVRSVEVFRILIGYVKGAFIVPTEMSAAEAAESILRWLNQEAPDDNT